MKKIGIIAAMDSEVSLLKSNIEQASEIKVAGSIYYIGKIGRNEIILTRCGIGKVSAALSAQVMISQFGATSIFNTGCAGALANGLGIGDYVISTSTAEWDIDIEAIGLPRGYVSALDTTEMKADEELTKMIEKAIPADSVVKKGMIVSGDQFVHRPEQRAMILSSFPTALCTEMEGAAIGHVCAQNGVPFCIIRCMSDTADGNSSVNFEEFSAIAGEKSGAIMLTLLHTND